METELWPNLYQACASRDIPVIIANARMSERSASGYHRFSWLTATLWPNVKHVAAQTEPDAQRFRYLGLPADRVTVTGTVKFDIAVSTDVVSSGSALRDRWGKARPVWIAASTHAGEDETVLAAHARIREAVPDCLLILVPRHPERFDTVDQLCRKSGYRVARRTANNASAETEVYLGDTMGELLLYFAAADVAFVGGSLVPVHRRAV
jgi:3-deoxy-D-manno-octulosonic-acid transferase